MPVYADSSAQVDFFIHGYTKLRFMGQDVYLGETFVPNYFQVKLNALRKSEINKADIMAFQEKELSAKKMTAGYQKRYGVQ